MAVNQSESEGVARGQGQFTLCIAIYLGSFAYFLQNISSNSLASQTGTKSIIILQQLTSCMGRVSWFCMRPSFANTSRLAREIAADDKEDK